MRMRRWMIVSLGLLVCVANASIAQQGQGVACGGKVVDAKGRPIAKARVILYHNWTRWALGNRVTQETESGADGSFAFRDPLQYSAPSEFPYGRDSYVIIASHPDYAVHWCNINKEQPKPGYELILTEPRSQTITVTDHDGKPLEGVRVWPYSIGDPAGAEVIFRDSLFISSDPGLVGGTTGPNGKAVIANLPKTQCGFHTTLKGYAQGLAFSGGRTIRLSKGATVAGSVVNEEGKPVEGAIVKFYTNWNLWQFFLAQSDAQGRFRVEDLPADGWDMSPWGKSDGGNGMYIITIEHKDYVAGETQDHFEPGEVDESFRIEASPGTLVKCRVVEADSDRPVAGARVEGSSQSGRVDGYSGKDGGFAFRVLPGEVSISSNSPPEGVYVLPGQGPRRSTQADAQGEEIAVTLEVPPIAGRLTTIRGKVQLPDGTPAGGVKIVTKSPTGYLISTGGGIPYTGTNADGSFELEDAPAGQTLFLYGNTSDFQYILTETINSIQDPTVLSAPLVMKKGRSASALLRNKLGEPCVNLAVNVTAMMWGDPIPRADEHRAETDAEGLLKIDGILPGMEYFIMDAKGSRSESRWPERYYNEKRVLISPPQPERKISSLEGIDITFSPDQARDKRMLLCFFDMQQRPSRNSVLELARQAGPLQEKGLIIIAVHASKMDDAALKTWVKENGIPFPVGIAQEDEAKARSTWGLKSLPWLILTDRKHTVVAEGFTFDELAAKIEETASAE